MRVAVPGVGVEVLLHEDECGDCAGCAWAGEAEEGEVVLFAMFIGDVEAG